jgi:hypothetical protein
MLTSGRPVRVRGRRARPDDDGGQGPAGRLPTSL